MGHPHTCTMLGTGSTRTHTQCAASGTEHGSVPRYSVPEVVWLCGAWWVAIPHEGCPHCSNTAITTQVQCTWVLSMAQYH